VGDPITRHLGERMRVLGIDPGLTRCGLGVVDGVPGRQPLLVAVDVIQTSSELDVARRLLAIEEAVETGLPATDRRRSPLSESLRSTMCRRSWAPRRLLEWRCWSPPGMEFR
jgi:hypothetical protein